MKISKASVYANRESILQALRDNSFTSVRVYYSGCGDSGGIEDVDIQGMDSKSNEPTVKFIQGRTSWDADRMCWNESIAEITLPLSEAIKEHCYDLLSRDHGGWENNDGGSGEFIFDPKDGKINWVHNEYYTETNTTECEV
jgi:hypothetical protein